MANTPATTVRKREDFYFTVGTDNYGISVNKANYTGDIATALGLTGTAPASFTKMSVTSAAKQGLLFPLKVKGTKNGRRAQATIYVPRNKLEDVFGAGGLKGKTFGGLAIKEVAPILKRLVTA